MRQECHEHPLWQDDFIRELQHGKNLTRVFQLATVWATNMIVGSYCFPRYVAALASRCETEAIRYGLLENAWDESGGYSHMRRSHFWLAVRLAELLGLKDQHMRDIRPLPEAQRYTDEHYHECTTGNFGTALGMLCLIEEFTTPEFSLIFKAFLRSCEAGMDMKPEDFVLRGGAEYFTANIADDDRHREEMPRLVALWLREQKVDLHQEMQVEKGLQPVLTGIRQSIDLRQKFFQGIYASTLSFS